MCTLFKKSFYLKVSFSRNWDYVWADISVAMQWGGGCQVVSSRRACKVTWVKAFQGIYCLALGTLLLVHMAGCVGYLCPCLVEIAAQASMFFFQCLFQMNFCSVYMLMHAVWATPPWCKRCLSIVIFSRLDINYILLKENCASTFEYTIGAGAITTLFCSIQCIAIKQLCHAVHIETTW